MSVATTQPLTERARLIVSAVASVYELTADRLLGDDSRHQVSEARQMAWALIYNRLSWSYRQIAQAFGRHETTVNFGHSRILKRIAFENHLETKFQEVKRVLEAQEAARR